MSTNYTQIIQKYVCNNIFKMSLEKYIAFDPEMPTYEIYLF